jgi:hypothetical protein
MNHCIPHDPVTLTSATSKAIFKNMRRATQGCRWTNYIAVHQAGCKTVVAAARPKSEAVIGRAA